MALTRASEELYVWVARMSWAEDTWTAKLQSFAMGCKLSFLGGMLAEACQRVFGFRVTQEDVARLWSMWQYEVPEQEEHCHGDALRRWQAPSASEFFDEPELWVEVWDELDWFPVPPALPKLEGIHEAEAMEAVLCECDRVPRSLFAVAPVWEECLFPATFVLVGRATEGILEG